MADIVNPGLPIVDAHHHLWDGDHPRYLTEEFYDDLNGSGHEIAATVFVECKMMYRRTGPEEFKSAGEAEFARGCSAAGASGRYGNAAICAAIVGHANLLLGDRVADVLQKLGEAGGDRFRGIRHIAANDPEVKQQAPRDMLADPEFRAGFAQLGKAGLSFDAWVYHPQLDDLLNLVRDFPDIPVVLCHAGGLIGMGSYAGSRNEAVRAWKESLRKIAALPNTFIKIGGLTMPVFGLGLEEGQGRVEQIAGKFRPIVEDCIEAFGPDRCMFESNFPVNRELCSYGDLWSAYKRCIAQYSQDEQRDLLGRTAARFYGISEYRDLL